MTDQRVIWVVGMHRSGTSLTAGVLRLLGADLGQQDGLLGADEADNPTGYQEQQAVIDLNNELLARFSGASWAPLRAKARQILAEFELGRVWAIKDPRLSLTLPFWLPLIDESSAAVCLRSPRDVAVSLHARDPEGPLSKRNRTAVWLDYTQTALANASAMPLETIFYDDWFRDPARQTRALTDLLEGPGVAVSEGAADKMEAFVRGGLRHHRLSLLDGRRHLCAVASGLPELEARASAAGLGG